MSKYHVKLDSAVLNVADVASAINKEEAFSNKFLLNELAWVAPAFTNLLTFEELVPGTLLSMVVVTKHGDPAPATHTEVWTGALIVAGRNEVVTVWRSAA